MASLTTCAPAPHSIAALRRPSAVIHSPYHALTNPAAHIHHARLYLRLKKEVRVPNRVGPIFASNTNPSQGSNGKKTSNDASGPPFLTVLAGVLVFLLVCWIIGSIVMWILGLIVHPPSLK